MPASSLISVNVILCEKVLQEEDHVYSAIRIVDVFYFRRNPLAPAEMPLIPMNVLVMGKSEPEDNIEHSVQLILMRPDEQPTPVGGPLKAVFESKTKAEHLLANGSLASDVVGGFSIRADISVVPRQVGRHQFIVYLDDEVVAKVPFTILELKPELSD